MNVSTASEVLAAMITPALLISASGTLVLSTSNRLTRVIDRVRTLSRDAEQLQASTAFAAQSVVAESVAVGSLRAEHVRDKRLLITRQLTSAAQRAIILRSALSAFYMAIGFLVAASITIGVLTWLHLLMTWPVIALALVGAGALLWGSLLLVREARIAIGSTLEEMQYIRKLVSETGSAATPTDPQPFTP
jgi:hypothetical protein